MTLQAALLMRKRYLCDEVALWQLYLACLATPIGPYPYGNLPQIKKELDEIDLELDHIKTPPSENNNDVTPQMIAQARDVPVDTLIEFVRGKARCPFHDDKVPSLFYGTRTNRAVCPSGCNDSWDSIGLTMKLNDLSFYDAVRRLCNR